MHAPDAFAETRRDVLIDAMRRVRLACIVTAGDGYAATHAPMVVREDGSALLLETHVAIANPHWRRVSESPAPSLAVFQGPHAYVTPSWYPSKAADGRVVPTWNYIAVHAHGTLEAERSPDWLLAHVSSLSDAQEADRPAPWALADAPTDYVARLARGVVGLRLRVERLEGAWKLSQNKSAEDRNGVAEGLAAASGDNAAAVAQAMSSLKAEGRL